MAHGERHPVFSHAGFLHDADLDLYHHPVGNGILDDPVGNDTLDDPVARGPIVWALSDGTVDLPGPRSASVEVAAHRSLRPAHR